MLNVSSTICQPGETLSVRGGEKGECIIFERIITVEMYRVDMMVELRHASKYDLLIGIAIIVATCLLLQR